MATKYLSANASLSAAVWWTTSGGTTTTTAPTTGDDANLNGHTLTVDQAFTCDNITGSGTLAVSGSRTITANLGTTADDFVCTVNGSQTITINGNVVGGVVNTSFYRLVISGASTSVSITGTVTGGTASNYGRGMSISAGTLVINGLVTAGSTVDAHGMEASGGTITITGAVNGSSPLSSFTNSGVRITGGVISFTGSIAANTGSSFTNNGGTLTLTGDVISTHSNSSVVVIGGGRTTINGDVKGDTSTGYNASSWGLSQTGGLLVVNGDVYAGSSYGGGATSPTYNIAPGLALFGGNCTLTGSIFNRADASAIYHSNGTLVYSPGAGKYVVIGGSTLTAGGGGSTVIIVEDD